jgi:hypothetical protein
MSSVSLHLLVEFMWSEIELPQSIMNRFIMMEGLTVLGPILKDSIPASFRHNLIKMSFPKVLVEPADRIAKMIGRSSVMITIKAEIKFSHLQTTLISERRKILTHQNLQPTITIHWNISLRKRPSSKTLSSMTKNRL